MGCSPIPIEQAVLGRETPGIRSGIPPLESESKQHLESIVRGEVESIKTSCCH